MNFEFEFVKVCGSIVILFEVDEEQGICISLSNTTKITFSYWRVLLSDGVRVSSFDHNQKYGSRFPIDAPQELKKIVLGRTISIARFDRQSGDLEIILNDGAKLQIFNFTGYEVWEVDFGDGTGQLSNYV